MGQSVTYDHLNAIEFLVRDITNIARFFSGYGIDIDTKELLEETIRT
jgi:serine/threonine-protein kinase RIO1